MPGDKAGVYASQQKKSANTREQDVRSDVRLIKVINKVYRLTERKDVI